MVFSFSESAMRPRDVPRDWLGAVDWELAFHRPPDSHARKQHWSAIFGGIKHHYCKPPFRAIAQWLRKRYDEFRGVVQRSRRRPAWQSNGLIKGTIPKHEGKPPEKALN
jgi:hypothetical protein